MIDVQYPPDLADAWAHVFGHAWHKDNRPFLQQLRKDPKHTITDVVNSGNPEQLVSPCATILEYVNSDNCEYGFVSLPALPPSLQGLSEEQLYVYASQSDMYGIFRCT